MKKLAAILMTAALILTLAVAVNAADPSISVAKTSFAPDETITVAYSGTATKDWIGLYNSDDLPGSVSSVLWEYSEDGDGSVQLIPGTTQGTLGEGEVLPEGDYVLYLCYNDGYDVLAQVAITITTQAAASGYPSSGYTPASGSIINGTVIGNETGWDETEACGAAAAFDGDADTFFDPLGVGDGFCGMDAGETYILTAVNILPRSGQLPRYLGAMIQGSNDGTTWTTLFTSEEEATDQVWYTTTEFDNNTGYRYYRYFNETNHGDVADVEFYGTPAAAAETEAAADTAAETQAAVEAPVEQAAQTFDMITVAIAALAVAGTGIVFGKKH